MQPPSALLAAPFASPAAVAATSVPIRRLNIVPRMALHDLVAALASVAPRTNGVETARRNVSADTFVGVLKGAVFRDAGAAGSSPPTFHLEELATAAFP